MNEDNSTAGKAYSVVKRVFKKSGGVAGKIINTGVEYSAKGIDKSTGASKYQIDAIAINGRLERALQAIEESLAQKNEENVKLSADLARANTEISLLHRQLAELQSRIAVVPSSATPPSNPQKRHWWQKSKDSQ